jgi:hypothetical protein
MTLKDFYLLIILSNKVILKIVYYNKPSLALQLTNL